MANKIHIFVFYYEYTVLKNIFEVLMVLPKHNEGFFRLRKPSGTTLIYYIF